MDAIIEDVNKGKFQNIAGTKIFLKRRNIYENKKEWPIKVIVLKIELIELNTKQNEDYFQKGIDEIIQKETDNLNEKIVLYEWSGNYFNKLKDKDFRDQKWFKI
jgi:hypothetical protein